eukprot:SM000005S17143  [mRNA]  locus=s5:429856:431258:+ [translate_table: standard]
MLAHAQATVRSTVSEGKPATPFSARFASADKQEVLSVLIRNTPTLRLSFFEVKDVTQLGELQEAAKFLLPTGAKVVSSRLAEQNDKKYYLYEFRARGKRVAMSVAVNKGKVLNHLSPTSLHFKFLCMVYVFGATAPEERWQTDAGLLRAATQQFAII